MHEFFYRFPRAPKAFIVPYLSLSSLWYTRRPLKPPLVHKGFTHATAKPVWIPLIADPNEKRLTASAWSSELRRLLGAQS